MAKGIDCAALLTAESAKALAASGMEFCCRYLVPEQYQWKRLTGEEAQAIIAAGMKVVSVFETTADRAKGGESAGTEDGKLAAAEATVVAQPAGSAVYFAVDFNAAFADCGAIEQYLVHAAAQLSGYKTGVYGSYLVVEEMAHRGACQHFWQTHAWSDGEKSPSSNIYQYQSNTQIAGINVDLNESYSNEGWWPLPPGGRRARMMRLLRIVGFKAGTGQSRGRFSSQETGRKTILKNELLHRIPRQHRESR